MSERFVTYVIIGVAFGFTQLWFAYWLVKLYKEKQRVLRQRRSGAPAARVAQDAEGPSRPAANPNAGARAAGNRPSGGASSATVNPSSGPGPATAPPFRRRAGGARR